MRGLYALPLGNDQSYPHGAVAPTVVAMTPSLTSTAETAGLDLIAPPFAFVAGSGTGRSAQQNDVNTQFLQVQHPAARAPSGLDDGRRSPRKLFRAVVARLFGRKP